MSSNLIKFTRLSCVLLAAGSLFAQVTADANLTGSVKDSSGASVPNAKVRLESVATGAVRDAQTSGTGEYRFDLVAPGNYTLNVSAPGFQTQVVTNLVLAVGSTATNNVTLQVGQQNQTITVESVAPLMNV